MRLASLLLLVSAGCGPPEPPPDPTRARDLRRERELQRALDQLALCEHEEARATLDAFLAEEPTDEARTLRELALREPEWPRPRFRRPRPGLAWVGPDAPPWAREDLDALAEARLDLRAPDWPLPHALDAIARSAPVVRIVVDSSVDPYQTRVSLNLRNIPAEHALAIVLEQTGLTATLTPSGVRITRRQ